MEKLFINRDYMTEVVTLGELFNKSRHMKLQTIELPDLDNMPRVSCIPEGLYVCNLTRYNKGNYPAYEITDVENRTHILIHIANYLHDILGCVGVGLNRDENIPAIWRSKQAYGIFMAYLDGVEQFELEIRNNKLIH